MKVKFEDVKFTKCSEYDPFSRYANTYGMATFWRADIWVKFMDTRNCVGRTKSECIKEARKMIKEINAE